MNSIPRTKEEGAVSQVHMNGLFLEKPGLLNEALKREEEWARAVPGYDSTMTRHKRPMTTLERSLYKLNAVRELGEWAKDFVDPDKDLEDDGSDGNMGKPMQLVEGDSLEQGLKELDSGGQYDSVAPVFDQEDGVEVSDEDTEIGVPTFYSQPCITAMPTAAVLQNGGGVPIRRDSVIVIIRHGKTEHNKLGLFTGWVSGVSKVPFCVVLLLSMLTRHDTSIHAYRKTHHWLMMASKKRKKLEGFSNCMDSSLMWCTRRGFPELLKRLGMSWMKWILCGFPS
jgi:hypothetical protein